MSAAEQALLIDCEGDKLVAIVHPVESPQTRGVLIVVGGPQYRVGSHRQFLLLARHLAQQGTPVLRFDYRGMGDSDGDSPGFENTAADIRAAVDAMFATFPGLNDVVIWGLCDAASGALIYAPGDARVSGIVLVNPWVRTEETLAKTYLKHYYWERFVNPKFWRQLLSGKVNVLRSLSELVGSASRVLSGPAAGGGHDANSNSASFLERMEEGLRRYSGRILFIVSGNDLTAAEFRDLVAASEAWQALVGRAEVQWTDFPPANHTFSRKEWRDQVAGWTEEWIKSW